MVGCIDWHQPFRQTVIQGREEGTAGIENKDDLHKSERLNLDGQGLISTILVVQENALY